MTLAIADCSLLCQPLTTSPSPFIMALKPVLATSAGSSFLPCPILVSSMSARAKNSVSVAPGMRQVTVTPVSLSSARSANEKEFEERLAGVVDGLIGARDEASDRTGDEDAAPLARAHVTADLLDEIDGAGDVGVHDAHDVIEILIEETFAKPSPGVCQERLHGTSANRRVKLVDSLKRGEVGLQCIDLGAHRLESGSRLLDLGFVGNDHEIESVLGTAFGEFIADTGRRAGNHGKRFGGWSHLCAPWRR